MQSPETAARCAQGTLHMADENKLFLADIPVTLDAVGLRASNHD